MKTEFITEAQIRKLFPERPSDCHKGSFGYVALIGGSLKYSGAIRLAAHALASASNAAMRSGAGVATTAAPRSICPLIAPQILESTLYPLSDNCGELVFSEEEIGFLCKRYQCIAFGMGIGLSDETLKVVSYLLTHYDRTLIVDADGLNAMARLDHGIIRSSRARLVLTPHLKEFSGLSGMSIEEAKADPSEAASYLADELDATVLLKGSTTVVAGPGSSRVLATDRGCAGMATAGSGDVLSGILSALCVNADDLVLAAAAGAYINGAAGELAQSRRSDVTMTSGDTALCVAEVIEGILRTGAR
ncbi:MAG: NAD(P)H-hydrate dehydratase [Mogibacterium sp.]|nr:NAD(P)H-hydrate dehydratase [Mogibacterium sp.]